MVPVPPVVYTQSTETIDTNGNKMCEALDGIPTSRAIAIIVICQILHGTQANRKQAAKKRGDSACEHECGRCPEIKPMLVPCRVDPTRRSKTTELVKRIEQTQLIFFLGMLIDASFCLYPANALGIPAKLVVFGWVVSQLVSLF
ncbi:hypothetical protein TWF718_000661 [Orbilia javanica]|uniref:Uncharacterized protein n=1 Tax=Orbilia javanica TaxID=47235 RepID=A0AAN8RG37_9PEZI